MTKESDAAATDDKYRSHVQTFRLELHPLLHQAIKEIAARRRKSMRDVVVDGFIKHDREVFDLFMELKRDYEIESKGDDTQ